MPSRSEAPSAGAFLLSEDNGQRSRDTITVAAGAGVIAPGAVLGRLSASGKFVMSPATGSDGSQTAVAVAFSACNATTTDQKIPAITRDAEVSGGMLFYSASVTDAAARTAKATQLANAGIIVR